jgi:hypothetical protein
VPYVAPIEPATDSGAPAGDLQVAEVDIPETFQTVSSIWEAYIVAVLEDRCSDADALFKRWADATLAKNAEIADSNGNGQGPQAESIHATASIETNLPGASM